MTTTIDIQELLKMMESDRAIQNIPMHEFCDRYYIDMRSGTIYDMVDSLEIAPDTVDGEFVVTLVANTGETRTLLLGDLLIRIIYGYTNSSFRPKLTEFPCNTSNLAPKVNKLIMLDDDRIEINDIVYRRWRDTEYYASDYGVVYSVPYGAFLRKHYNEKNYCLVGMRDGDRKYTYRVHRIVWESIHGLIPDHKEIDHINAKRWDNAISNLQLMTHVENLQKMRDLNYTILSDDDIVSIGKYLLDGIPSKELAEKYNVSRDIIADIKYRDYRGEILRAAGIDLSNISRDNHSGLTKKDISDIVAKREAKVPVSDIADEYGISRATVYNLVKNAK